jgi:hypothetical protein
LIIDKFQENAYYHEQQFWITEMKNFSVELRFRRLLANPSFHGVVGIYGVKQ